MDLINDFRDKDRILTIQKIIQSKISKPINIMEICGGHTHSIMKFGLPSLLPKEINFVHGPGCPVCVMPRERIDTALKLASMPNTIFCVLGDMLRVPGSYESLIDLRAKGADIRALYTPLEVINIALENKDKTIIFFAIGFETTTPMSASIIQKRIEFQLENLFFHINHVLVPPAVEAIMQDEKVKIDAFLGPSHVSVITGSNIYKLIAKKYKTPIAVSGFEPVDIMLSVLNIVEQMNANTYEVYNEYHRVVSKEGNLKAKSLMQTYFQPCDFEFRGLGVIKDGGLCLKDEFSNLDASKIFDCKVQSKDESKACICGQILRGLAKPYDCKVFAKACTPKNPIGSCMVSSEGACAAYYKYHQN
ncbi:hydrogenase formation protein HypD [Campylobacter volucris]|uniref:hydrogenase formation protein HypD n=1 Tax=Campylobacter volucris TaxID=1031542 RepID=UPI00189F5D94|nr:hydrogenase formation protein HypD [Campylobacter volucris]MBF7048817.1 hydrogenase formation protein HypD [Campylobacter volucris]MBF7060688.1 hydrogenase formation protein HypD [Campylobacter volucris]